MIQWLGLSTFRAQVRSLVGELRSHKLHSMATKKREREKEKVMYRYFKIRLGVCPGGAHGGVWMRGTIGEGDVLYFELCPPKMIWWRTNPSTSECDRMQRHGLHRGNQIKVRLLGWTLTQYDWYLY